VLLPSDRSRLCVPPRLVAARFCYQIRSPTPVCPAGFDFHWSGLFSFTPAEFLRPVGVHCTGSCHELLPSARQSFHKSGSRALCCSSAQGLLGFCDLGFVILFECEALQVDFSGVLLSHRIKSLEDLWSKSFSRGSFPNTPTKCSVKCLREDKLFF
jgi:hypothetical protein